VTGSEDRGHGEIEWLDEPPADPGSDVIEHAPHRLRVPSLNRRWGFALAAVALVAGAVALAAPRDSDPAAKASAARPSTAEVASPSPVAPSGVPATAAVPAGPPSIVPRQTPSSAPPGPVVTTENGAPFLVGAPANLEIFARGPEVVLRLQLAIGRVTATAVPDLNSTGPVALLAGSNAAIVRPLDSVAGYQIPDSGPAVPLTGLLADGGTALPGPDPAHVWIETDAGATSGMQLVTLDGRADGPSIVAPAAAGTPSSDDAGYLLFASLDGFFAARPGSLHRVTTGPLMAVGPTRWLAEQCDDQLRCGLVVINRSTGTSRALSTPPGIYDLYGGQISPDGRTAAMIGITASSDAAQLHLLDLTTGADRAIPIAVDQTQSLQAGAFAWSPDSRWLFAIDNGAVSAIDRSTGQRQVIITGSVQLSQLAVRVDS
jgi:hypothetical protein